MAGGLLDDTIFPESGYGSGAVVDANGNLYVVTFTSNTIAVRKSTDGGSNWSTIRQVGISSFFTNANSIGAVYSAAMRPEWTEADTILGESSPGTTIAINAYSDFYTSGMSNVMDQGIVFFKCSDWGSGADTMPYFAPATGEPTVTDLSCIYGGGGWNHEGDYYCVSTTTASNMGSDYRVAVVRLYDSFGASTLSSLTALDRSGNSQSVQQHSFAHGDMMIGSSTSDGSYQYSAMWVSGGGGLYLGMFRNTGTGVAASDTMASVTTWSTPPTTFGNMFAGLVGSDGTGSVEYNFLALTRDSGSTSQRLKGIAHLTTSAGIIGSEDYEFNPLSNVEVGNGSYIIARKPGGASSDFYLIYKDSDNNEVRYAVYNGDTGAVVTSPTSVYSHTGAVFILQASVVEQANGDVLLTGAFEDGTNGEVHWFTETLETGSVGGSAAISHGHTVTATGRKGGRGSGSISHGHTVTATGFKGGEGSASISHGHTVTAAGNAIENKSGSAAISHGHTVTATGNALEVRSGAGSISHGHTTTAAGEKGTSAGPSISHGHTVTATGFKGVARPASITHGHSVTATGQATDNRNGTASISHGHTVTASGFKGGAGAVPTISHGHTTAADGAKGGAGAASISHPHTVTATGDPLEVRDGSASIDHGHTVTASGQKGAAGSGSISHGHTVTANGIGPDPNARSGSASISHGHSVTASGFKGGVGGGAISHGHTVTGVGAKTGSSGTAAITHGHTVVATGTKSDSKSGSASISHGHTVAASGFKGAAGTVGIAHAHTTQAQGVKGALATAAISHGHTVVAQGVSDAYDGSPLAAWSGSEWVVGTLKRWTGSGWAGALVRRWNGSSWEDVT